MAKRPNILNANYIWIERSKDTHGKLNSFGPSIIIQVNPVLPLLMENKCATSHNTSHK